MLFEGGGKSAIEGGGREVAGLLGTQSSFTKMCLQTRCLRENRSVRDLDEDGIFA